MNKYLWFLVLFCCCTISEAQIGNQRDTTYYRYDDSIGTESLSNYYAVRTKMDDGTMSVKEYYRFTKPHRLKSYFIEIAPDVKYGAYAHYAKDGFIKEEGFYKNDERDGEIIFYKMGQIQRKVPYKKGKQDGIASYFHEGRKLYEWTWKNGKSDGYNESTYDDGSVRFKGTYVNEKLEGEVFNYYKDTLSSFNNYKNGKRQGASKEYHKNGTLFAEGSYDNSDKVGVWEFYREDGSLASIEEYSNSGRLKDLTFYETNGDKVKSRKKDKFTGVIDDKKRLQKIIQKHMSDNYTYPQLMESNGYEARVYISFKIDVNGDVVDVKTRSDAHISFDIQAENLIKLLPRQEPSKVHNVLIETPYSLPLAFRID